MSIAIADKISEVVPQVITDLEAFAKSGKVNVGAMALVAKGMEILKGFENLNGTEKKEVLVAAFSKIAVGKDGVAGTEDDIIPEAVVASVRVLLEKDLIGETIDVFASISKGQFDFSKAASLAGDGITVAKGCFVGTQKLCAKRTSVLALFKKLFTKKPKSKAT